MKKTAEYNALFEAYPSLRAELPWLSLGQYPTPLQCAKALSSSRGEVFLKREDLSSPHYGGNKIRNLEFLFADAQRRGAKRIWSTGAWGSNHALATVLHAPRVGLRGAAMLFPQRATRTAGLNLQALVSAGGELHATRSVLSFPFDLALKTMCSKLDGCSDVVMQPGGATPLGTLGHLSGALEFCQQVRRKEVPSPAHIVLPVGSTCTSAGLIAGFTMAQKLGFGLQRPMILHAVRTTPWPVTAEFRIRNLAQKCLGLLEHRLGAERLNLVLASKKQELRTYGFAYLGWGYGAVTQNGLRAKAHFSEHKLVPLDTTYTAKAGAGLLELRKHLDGPIVFWSTKSSVPLPITDSAKIERLSPRLRLWLRRALTS